MHRTLNLTIRQICIPTLSPAPFQAGSVCADSFFTYTTNRTPVMPLKLDYWRRQVLVQVAISTFLSVSEPNSARLLSFQSYFLAFLSPAIFFLACSRSSACTVHAVKPKSSDVIEEHLFEHAHNFVRMVVLHWAESFILMIRAVSERSVHTVQLLFYYIVYYTSKYDQARSYWSRSQRNTIGIVTTMS